MLYNVKAVFVKKDIGGIGVNAETTFRHDPPRVVIAPFDTESHRGVVVTVSKSALGAQPVLEQLFIPNGALRLVTLGGPFVPVVTDKAKATQDGGVIGPK